MLRFRLRITEIFLFSSKIAPVLASSSARICTGTGSFPSTPSLSAKRTSLMKTKVMNREERKSKVLSWSEVMQKYAHFCLPGSVRSISS